jgi:hypothetical protein
VRTDCTARTKNGQPPHSTTGVASTSWSQTPVRGSSRDSKCSPGTISPMVQITSGSVRMALTQKRRVMSSSSLVSSSPSTTPAGSSAMPHSGHAEARTSRTSGCMGQVYTVP